MGSNFIDVNTDFFIHRTFNILNKDWMKWFHSCTLYSLVWSVWCFKTAWVRTPQVFLYMLMVCRKTKALYIFPFISNVYLYSILMNFFWFVIKHSMANQWRYCYFVYAQYSHFEEKCVTSASFNSIKVLGTTGSLIFFYTQNRHPKKKIWYMVTYEFV